MEQKEKCAYTYMVECKDGSFYTGWTNDLTHRLRNHLTGKGAKYTKSRLPIRLIYYEVFHTKQEAMKREYAIKQLTKKDKLKLLELQDDVTKEQCIKIMKEITDSLTEEK